MPKRIQRQRTKGYRMPANIVSVTRPGRYGNPYRIGDKFPVSLSCYKWYGDGTITRENCLLAFAAYAEKRLLNEPAWLDPVRGKDVACFCRLTDECHGDILLGMILT